jgi:hypothetical protein
VSPSGAWLFDTPSPWTVTVFAVPTFETNPKYFAVVAPEIARARLGAACSPCVVVARVTARPAPGRTKPGGPKDRAKGLMDALHDGRKYGPKYSDLGAIAPLSGDHPGCVCGLAVEVQVGDSDRVEYLLGTSLTVAGRLLMAPIDVHVPAPNDISASAAEKARIDAGRKTFVEDLVRRCDLGAMRGCGESVHALVIRHRPQRDEDNTWATWVSALTGGSDWSRAAWPSSGSPFSGWSPMAIASVADSSLPCEVRYEVYGG